MLRSYLFFIGTPGWMLPDFDSMLKPYGFHFCRFGQTTSSRTLPIQPGLLVGLVWVALFGDVFGIARYNIIFGHWYSSSQGLPSIWLSVPGNPPVKHGNFGQQKTQGFRLEKRKNMRLMDSFDLHVSPTFAMIFGSLCIFGANGRWFGSRYRELEGKGPFLKPRSPENGRLGKLYLSIVALIVTKETPDSWWLILFIGRPSEANDEFGWIQSVYLPDRDL